MTNSSVITLSEAEKIFTISPRYRHLKMVYENLLQVKRNCLLRGDKPSEELTNKLKSLQKEMTDEIFGYVYF